MQKMTLPEFMKSLKNRDIPPKTEAEILQEKSDNYNNLIGKLGGVNCEICKNKGLISFVKNDSEYMRECQCMAARKTLKHVKNSGLQRLYESCTFENFRADSDWQKTVKTKALEYAENPVGWFFFGGQSGAGKTHICVSIVGELLKKGLECRYMLWRDESVWLKSNVNDFLYTERIKKLKNIPVLYIDDLFKGGEKPTNGDINLAFELLNYRTVSGGITIISSEYTLKGIIELDMAIGGRICEMAEKYLLNLPKDLNKNYRLKQWR